MAVVPGQSILPQSLETAAGSEVDLGAAGDWHMLESHGVAKNDCETARRTD